MDGEFPRHRIKKSLYFKFPGLCLVINIYLGKLRGEKLTSQVKNPPTFSRSEASQAGLRKVTTIF